jgi:hypothetical protein
MRNAEEYATTGQLRTEATIVERVRRTGAAALSGLYQRPLVTLSGWMTPRCPWPSASATYRHRLG